MIRMIDTALPGLMGDAVVIAVAVCGLSLALAFIRLVRGPTLADRVVALDLVSSITIVLLTLFALTIGDGAYLDAAIALALVAFLATVAFARYIDRAPVRKPDGGRPDAETAGEGRP
jgi:multicomponent Na+:H+ antiporter subunit F